MRFLAHRHQHNVVDITRELPAQLLGLTLARAAHLLRREGNLRVVLRSGLGLDAVYGSAWLLGLLLADHSLDLLRRVPGNAVRAPPGKQLVEDYAERVGV